MKPEPFGCRRDLYPLTLSVFVSRFISLVLTAGAVAQSPQAPAQAPGSAAAYVWDLASLYPDSAAWSADREFVTTGFAGLARGQGRAGRSAADLADVLDRVRAVRGRAGKMARFALLSSEVDQRNSEMKSRLDAATALEARVESAVAPVEAEIRGIGQARIRAWQAVEPRLEPHRRRLHKILLEADNAPEPAVQSVVAVMERWPRSLADAAGELADSDIGWTAISDTGGRELRVDAASYNRFKRSSERSVRDPAASAFFARQAGLEGAFGMLLSRRIEADLELARLRGFENHLDAFYRLRDGVPRGSYRHVVEVPRLNPETARRLAVVLARLHRTERASFLDLQGRFPFRGSIPVERALETIVAASAPLGTEYQSVLRQRLAQPWMHLPAASHKSGTVGVFWQVGGGHPYTLLTYRDDLASSRAFALAATLMMTYADIPPEASPDRREEDPPIHGNTIWYVGGLLHDDYLLDHIADRDDRIALLALHLQAQVRAAFQLPALVELEDRIRSGVVGGKPLTGEQISAAYLEMLRGNFAHGEGGLHVDDLLARQWISEEPSFFYGPFPAVFVSAAAGAALLVEKLRVGDRNALAAMRNAMGRDESDYSHDLLLKAGVDLTTAEPYRALLRRIDRILTRLEKELAAP